MVTVKVIPYVNESFEVQINDSIVRTGQTVEVDEIKIILPIPAYSGQKTNFGISVS